MKTTPEPYKEVKPMTTNKPKFKIDHAMIRVLDLDKSLAFLERRIRIGNLSLAHCEEIK